MNKNDIEQPKVKKHAVALSYQQENNAAPKVIAKGSGATAERIVSTAVQHAIPVYQNKTLVSMLMAIELDREIPPELYQAVAEILAYVYRVDQQIGKK